jgi:hypothetical protein
MAESQLLPRSALVQQGVSICVTRQRKKRYVPTWKMDRYW